MVALVLLVRPALLPTVSSIKCEPRPNVKLKLEFEFTGVVLIRHAYEVIDPVPGLLFDPLKLKLILPPTGTRKFMVCPTEPLLPPPVNVKRAVGGCDVGQLIDFGEFPKAVALVSKVAVIE